MLVQWHNAEDEGQKAYLKGPSKVWINAQSYHIDALNNHILLYCLAQIMRIISLHKVLIRI